MSLDQIKEWISYDPLTGIFQYKKCATPQATARFANKPISSIYGKGYIGITVDGQRIMAHRLSWFFMKGVWPDGEIDHKNGVRTDNRWDNLRLAIGSTNQINTKIHKHNTSGHRGVSWSKTYNKWVACVYVENKQKRLGYFSNIEDAIKARQQGEVTYYGLGSRLRP